MGNITKKPGQCDSRIKTPRFSTHLSLKTICLSELRASIHRPTGAPLVKTIQKTKPVTASTFLESRESRFKNPSNKCFFGCRPFQALPAPSPSRPPSELTSSCTAPPNGAKWRPGPARSSGSAVRRPAHPS